MSAKKTRDLGQFANRARVAVTMSAPDTLTFQELHTGVDFRENVAWIIHEIHYRPYSATLALMTASQDSLEMALVTRDNLVDLAADQSEVIDALAILRLDFGTAGNAKLILKPMVRSFVHLPQGGLIIPAESLFLGMKSSGLASAGGGEIVIFFSYEDISDANYTSLVRSYRVIS